MKGAARDGKTNSGPIGIFDSGFGGLNTLRHLVAKFPENDYLYLGDAARVPYGPRPAHEICSFSEQAIDFLYAHGCRLIIFACNTASSDALHVIQTEYLPRTYPSITVLGVLIPLAEAAVATTFNRKIGVIATLGTVGSGAFIREISKLDPTIELFQEAAPVLVPLIEAGDYRSVQMHDALAIYLYPLIEVGIDTLILGCTHYEIVKDQVSKIVGSEVTVISEGSIVAEKLQSYLGRHPDRARSIGRGGTYSFYTTGDIKHFDELGSVFFGSSIHAQMAILG